MEIPLYIINAFTTTSFGGNPAAVCPLDEWLPDDTLQHIAAQHNLSETAFFVATPDAETDYEIRWFTPTVEVNLCGHATLASAFVIYNLLGFEDPEILFESRSGPLFIERHGGKIHMNFPKTDFEYIGMLATFSGLLGVRASAAYTAKGSQPDLVLMFENESQVQAAEVNMQALKSLPEFRCVIPTAPSDDDNVDFVCRVFAPNYGILEDPVTGSAYTLLAPIWAERLNKQQFVAKQLSQRGGDVWCDIEQERVVISGCCCLYAKGEIYL